MRLKTLKPVSNRNQTIHSHVPNRQEKGVDLDTIIQSYNMGAGYIDFVAEHGGSHTEELAKQYPSKQVKKNPKLYTCGGNKDNFRYPYCYGDYRTQKSKSKNKNR